ncbi:hypothetical protein C2845_PM11G14700 [Panicum miliaceum]|uniref:Uncharacterized protein n=1 Tax=Panicum miliaceum TaxID=4540 RepID=A0A3L6RN64_PANMI|nr:hypothetical protein C2845_PM11G14700 [Panicum miliaceum]
MRAPSSTPCKPLLGKDRYSNEEALKSSSVSGPLRLLCPAMSTLSAGHLPRPAGMLPLNLLWVRSSTANDDELMQNDDGIKPWKLLLLALSTTRFLVFSHAAECNSPVNRAPLRWLKLTLSTAMLLEASSSDGRLPEKELCDRLRL